MASGPDPGSGMSDANLLVVRDVLRIHPVLLCTAARGRAERAARSGFQVETKDGRAQIRLPCHHLDGATCTIYRDRRPDICGEFPLRAPEAADRR